MSINFGGSEQKQKGNTILQTPPPSASEQAYQQNSAALVQEQLNQLRQQQADQAAYKASPAGQAQQQLSDLATQRLLQDLTGNQVLNPAEQARLDTAYGSAQQQGEDSVRQFAKELAASHGMNLSDSPVAGAALKNLSTFQQGLQSAKAQAALDRQNIERNFAANLNQFQQGLRQQQFTNALAYSQAQPGLGLAGLQQQDRFGNRSSSQTGNQFGSNWSAGTGSNSGVNWGNVINAFGQLV